jgi:hypothetical protein
VVGEVSDGFAHFRFRNSQKEFVIDRMSIMELSATIH